MSEYETAKFSRKTILQNLKICVGELKLPKGAENFKPLEFAFNEVNLDNHVVKLIKRPNVVITHLKN